MRHTFVLAALPLLFALVAAPIQRVRAQENVPFVTSYAGVPPVPPRACLAGASTAAELFLFGGFGNNNSWLSDIYALTASNNVSYPSWRALPTPMPSVAIWPVAVQLNANQILLLGSTTLGDAISSVPASTTTTQWLMTRDSAGGISWETQAAPTPFQWRAGPCATRWGNNVVLLGGVYDDPMTNTFTSYLNDTYVLSLPNSSDALTQAQLTGWTSSMAPWTARSEMACAAQGSTLAALTAELVFDEVLEDGQDDSDYHNTMNGAQIIAWLRNRLFPTFAHLYPGKKIYLVLDNASYHAPQDETWVSASQAQSKHQLAHQLLDLEIEQLITVDASHRVVPSHLFEAKRSEGGPSKDDLLAAVRKFLEQHPDRNRTVIEQLMSDKGYSLIYTRRSVLRCSRSSCCGQR